MVLVMVLVLLWMRRCFYGGCKGGGGCDGGGCCDGGGGRGGGDGGGVLL